uniref:Uncharacterized protein n=1 Tax=Rhizophora mucronata TaxID=61149 RepID=A0A2P2N8C0_RHIMU
MGKNGVVYPTKEICTGETLKVRNGLMESIQKSSISTIANFQKSLKKGRP